MAIAEATTSDDTTKYWVTDTQLQLLADAIRKEGGTTALLTYPDGFISAINNLEHVKTETLNVTWPAEYNNIYWTTKTELQNIANAIRSKNSSSETLTFIRDFINNLVVINEKSSNKISIYPMHDDFLFSFDGVNFNLMKKSVGTKFISGTKLYLKPIWDLELDEEPESFPEDIEDISFYDWINSEYISTINITWYNKYTENVYCSFIVPNLDDHETYQDVVPIQMAWMRTTTS